jgi:UDP-N-acetylmuramate dehydrogenase
LRSLKVGGSVEVHERVDLREWNALRVGGPADVIIRCGTAEAVSIVMDHLASHGLRWLVLGGGSRLVPPDRGLRVPLIALTGELVRWDVDLDGFEAGAGAKLAQVGGSVARAGLSGMERLFDTRGSVGGAVHLSAEAGGEDLRRRFEWVEYVDPGRGVLRWIREGRSDFFPMERNCRKVVVRSRFSLEAPVGGVRHPQNMSGLGGRLRRVRPSARMFNDLDDVSVADLVARAGCAGVAVGGVGLSEDDPCMVVASRMATARDVLELSLVVSRLVRDACGVMLESVLCFVDEEGRRIPG